MYRQQLAKKTSLSSPSTPVNKQAIPSPNYGSLSGTIQRAAASPESLREDEWLQLHKAIGTRATNEIKSGQRTSYVPEFKGISAQLLGDSGGNKSPIQAKLTMGETGDKYEQEADKVAAEVVQQINPPTPVSNVQGEVVQRAIDGADPIEVGNILDPTHVNDLLYGLTNYRQVTKNRIAEPKESASKRTIDQYNDLVGITGNIINSSYSCVGLYLVRKALENPAEWKKHLTASQFDYPQEGKALSNEQKWMTFLVRDKYNIGLWDLGNTNREKKNGKAEGLTRIKSKKRLAKNMPENEPNTLSTKKDKLKTFLALDKSKSVSAEEVYTMLSFGIDDKAAMDYYTTLEPEKQTALNRWIQNAFWRRTSKLGIDFATSIQGLDAYVHFNLTSGVKQDGAWQAKLWGILDDIAEDKGKRKITESEFRYILRQIKKNPEIRERIIFYSEY